MKTDNATSGSTSARTSADDARASTADKADARKLADDLKNDPQARPNADRPQPLHPESSEADFLTLQQEHARAAIGRVVSEIKGALAEGADPRTWVHQYPWATLGATAVAGFVAATMLIPSREQQALKKLAEIERALNPPPRSKAERERDDHPDSVDGKADADDYKSGKQSFMTALLGEAIKAVRPALISLLTAGVTAKAAKPSEEEMKAAAAAENQEEGRAQGPTS
jgi:hypothetical protein